jgi:hypothetical protein
MGAAITNAALSGFAGPSGSVAPGFGSQEQTPRTPSSFGHLNLGLYYLGKKNYRLAQQEFALSQAPNEDDRKR